MFGIVLNYLRICDQMRWSHMISTLLLGIGFLWYLFTPNYSSIYSELAQTTKTCFIICTSVTPFRSKIHSIFVLMRPHITQAVISLVLWYSIWFLDDISTVSTVFVKWDIILFNRQWKLRLFLHLKIVQYVRHVTNTNALEIFYVNTMAVVGYAAYISSWSTTMVG